MAELKIIVRNYYIVYDKVVMIVSCYWLLLAGLCQPQTNPYIHTLPATGSLHKIAICTGSALGAHACGAQLTEITVDSEQATWSGAFCHCNTTTAL
jgi:hypothetical protein